MDMDEITKKEIDDEMLEISEVLDVALDKLMKLKKRLSDKGYDLRKLFIEEKVAQPDLALVVWLIEGGTTVISERIWEELDYELNK
jgi:hypothetical protein